MALFTRLIVGGVIITATYAATIGSVYVGLVTYVEVTKAVEWQTCLHKGGTPTKESKFYMDSPTSYGETPIESVVCN